MIRLNMLAAVVCVEGLALASNCGAATISAEGPNPPTTNVLASQTIGDPKGVTRDPARDFTNNGGPPGQTFTVPSDATVLLGAITILGDGHSKTPLATFGGFNIQIGSVDPATGAITQLDNETVPAPAANNDFITIKLDNPVPVTFGTIYEFSLDDTNSASFFGLARSNTDAYSGGVAFNNNLTTDNTKGNANPKEMFNGFVAPIPAGYDFTFVAQSVPEPATLGVLPIAAVAVIARRRRESCEENAE